MLNKTPLIYEIGSQGRRGYLFPECDVPEISLADIVGKKSLRTKTPRLPSVSEIEVVRHFTALASQNFGVDSGFYPLGSCTMKYNPKVNELIPAMDGFAASHPNAPDADSQGSLQVIFDMERYLSAICGMDAFTLQPSAGAHGELTGLMIMAAYHQSRGEFGRKVILIPDSAHGTNPASASLAGFETISVPSDKNGLVDITILETRIADVGERLAGFMLTCPNTLGLFECNVLRIAEMIHSAGGLLYYDGANLNAIMGKTSPGVMGFDIVHVNLHKTFATPHGGGGPGSGPVGVTKRLEKFLPVPRVTYNEGKYTASSDYPFSVGRIRSFYGNFGVVLKAFAYILSLGADGLREASETAVLNANYIKKALEKYIDVPYSQTCLHEFVASAGSLKDNNGISATDISKNLIDRGFHPPTMYFPLIVREALMIEPTETETRETLDSFIEAMKEIITAACTDPESVKNSPVTTPVSRPDDVKAAKHPVLKG